MACVAVSDWTNARLAAETVIVPAEEGDLASVEAEVISGAGGVILFGSSAPASLGTQVMALKAHVPDKVGILVMTDEEGGGVQRMSNLVGNLPWASYMGQNWSGATITKELSNTARAMRASGVNMDLAPVVDVDGRDVPPGASDPDGWRSISGNSSLVTRDGLAFARGLLAGGVIPVLKHFPGLGGASGNTDNGTAYTLPWAALKESALNPFSAGIATGLPAIMVSNAIVPGLTTLPASLSPDAIAGELEGNLHFNGLILTDSLSAGAISDAGFSVPAAAVQALRAGADMVMYSTQADPAATERLFQATVASIVASLSDGRLSRARVESAARAALKVRHINVCS